MTPDQRRKMAKTLRQPQTDLLPEPSVDPKRSALPAGTNEIRWPNSDQVGPAILDSFGPANLDSCKECIRNVVESHEVYLEAIQEDLANYQGILRVLLQRLANNPNDQSILGAIQSVENQITSRERDEEIQSARLSGASDCSGC